VYIAAMVLHYLQFKFRGWVHNHWRRRRQHS